MRQVQLYNDQLTFDENKKKGPFGAFANIKAPYKNKGEPAYDFFGIPVYSPFGIGAGPLPTTKFIKAALDTGFDIVTLKNVRSDDFPLNPYPNVRPVLPSNDLDLSPQNKLRIADSYTEPLSIANSFGIPSPKPEDWQPFVKASSKIPGKGQALLAAFQGTARGKGREDFVQDHVRGVELLQQTGDHIIEINLSCPNEGKENLACFDVEITTRIVDAVRDTYPDLKFMIKLGYFEDKNLLKKLVRKIGTAVDGISGINTIPMTVVDKKGDEVFPGRRQAGISGAPVKWAGLEMTRSLRDFREEFGFSYKIVSMGGVLNAKDFHEYISSGADIVMSVTGAMWNPDLAAEIKQSLS